MINIYKKQNLNVILSLADENDWLDDQNEKRLWSLFYLIIIVEKATFNMISDLTALKILRYFELIYLKDFENLLVNVLLKDYHCKYITQDLFHDSQTDFQYSV